MARFSATNIKRRTRPHSTSLRDIYTGEMTHNIVEVFRLPALNILTGNNISRCKDSIYWLLKTVSSNDESIRAGILCPSGKGCDRTRRQQRSFFNHCKASTIEEGCRRFHQYYAMMRTRCDVGRQVFGLGGVSKILRDDDFPPNGSVRITQSSHLSLPLRVSSRFALDSLLTHRTGKWMLQVVTSYCPDVAHK